MEGSPRKRRALDKAPLSLEKILRRMLKHGIWLLIGVATGGAFVFYFADAPTLMGQFLDGTAPYAAWFSLAFLTLGTYIFAGFAREQVCIYMCPYARFQGAMFDKDTLIVAYDEARGEPRIANRRKRREAGSGAGACIDCGECVRVCPTAIDIRDGQQYQCITCAACIDACNEVMDLIGQPCGLVRYTSMHALEGKKTLLVRPRLFAYGGILTLVMVGIAATLMGRSDVELNVIRHRSPVYIRLSDGGVQNNFTLRLLNITSKPQRYRLRMEGLEAARLQVAAVDTRDADGAPILEARSGEVVPFQVYVRQPGGAVKPGKQDVAFVVESLDSAEGSSDRYESVFVGPS